MNNKTITIDIEKFILSNYYLDNENLGMLIRLIMFSKLQNGLTKENVCDLIIKNASMKLNDEEISTYANDILECFSFDVKKEKYSIDASILKFIIINPELFSDHINHKENMKDLSHTKEQKPKIYVKKSERNVTFSIPSLDEVIEYFLVNGYTSETAEKAFKYYSAANWMDSNNRPVTNWKQKMLGVWFKEQYKIKSK